MNKKIDYFIKLKGEYCLTIFSNNQQKYTTDWQSNTILSGGLVNLYDTNVSSLLSSLDFGISRDLPGSAGYTLSGVITPISNIAFRGINAALQDTYIEDLSAQVYYSRFQTPTTNIAATLNEFCIRNDSEGFSRNVFDTEIVIEPNQYVVFEYRLRASRYASLDSTIPFTTYDRYTFTVPVSSIIYNIPYPEIYKPGSILILASNKESLPEFGKQWPLSIEYALGRKISSTFSSQEIGRGLDNDTRTYTVSTIFANISASTPGVFNAINSLILSRAEDDYNTILNPFEEFMVTKLKFPLTLYQFPSNYFQSSIYTTPYSIYATPCATEPTEVQIISPYYGTTYSTQSIIANKSLYNAITLYYNFSWYEC